MESPVMPMIELDSGISVPSKLKPYIDWSSIRTLYESGMDTEDLAEHFKVSKLSVATRARDEHWLRPYVVDRMRLKLAERQREMLKRTGKAESIAEVKARIWEERGEKLKEKAYQIAKKALEAVDDGRAGTLIENANDFARLVDVSRKISGEEKRDSTESGPTLAVNIGFLRGARPVDASPVVDIDPS